VFHCPVFHECPTVIKSQLDCLSKLLPRISPELNISASVVLRKINLQTCWQVSMRACQIRFHLQCFHRQANVAIERSAPRNGWLGLKLGRWSPRIPRRQRGPTEPVKKECLPADRQSCFIASMIISLVNSKGGVGKSTLAGNLAGWLARQGRSVILADCDTQQSSSEWIREALPEIQVVRLADADAVLDELPVAGSGSELRDC
jgi:hypothetical protein